MIKPLFPTAPLVAVNEPVNLALIPLFFSTETQGTQSYTERHCERSEAIQSVDFYWIASGYRPRKDATHIHVISKRFLASLEMTMRLVWRGGSSGGCLISLAASFFVHIYCIFFSKKFVYLQKVLHLCT